MSGHRCRESEDPRRKGHCACGKPVVKLLRILQVEREFTQEACRGHVDASRLIEHAETRSKALCREYVRDPMEILPGLNRLRETREELADARNHLVFFAQEKLGDEELLGELQLVLRDVARAYDRLARL